MTRLVSTINWHNAVEESPKKDGIYLTITTNHITIKHLNRVIPSMCYALPYSVKLDKWNVTYDPFGETDMSTEIEDVKWWASAEDINEVYIKEGKDE